MDEQKLDKLAEEGWIKIIPPRGRNKGEPIIKNHYIHGFKEGFKRGYEEALKQRSKR